MTSEKCQRCGEPGPDLRTLRMSCLYDMSELNVPFRELDHTFLLTVCKSCRADWMVSIQQWFKDYQPRLAKLLGDINAVGKNKIGRRIARRTAGKVTGKLFGKLFK